MKTFPRPFCPLWKPPTKSVCFIRPPQPQPRAPLLALPIDFVLVSCFCCVCCVLLSQESSGPPEPFLPHYANKMPWCHHSPASHAPVGSLTPAGIYADGRSSLICPVVTCLAPSIQIPVQFSTNPVSYQPAPPRLPSPQHSLLAAPEAHCSSAPAPGLQNGPSTLTRTGLPHPDSEDLPFQNCDRLALLPKQKNSFPLRGCCGSLRI